MRQLNHQRILSSISSFLNFLESHLAYIIILLFLLVWYNLFLFREINLAAVDLGRHLKNGQEFLQNFQVPSANFYSYTYPDYPFINHHWGAGVIFYLIWKTAGFSGLSFFYIALSLLTFFIFFHLTQKMAGLAIATPVALLVIPLIGERSEVRPEVFSYFFAALFFWLMRNWRKGKISSRWLFLLPLIEVLWINTHIYFFLGFFLIGAFWLEELFLNLKIYLASHGKFLSTKGIENLKRLSLVLFATIVLSFLNPFTFKAVIYPLEIFRNYGYRVIENQSVWFLEKLGMIQNPNFTLFKIVSLVLVLSFFWAALNPVTGRIKRWALAYMRFLKIDSPTHQNIPHINTGDSYGQEVHKNQCPEPKFWCGGKPVFSFSLLTIGLTFTVIAGLAIRNFTLFGFFVLPIISYNLKNGWPEKTSFNSAGACLISFIFCAAIITFSVFSYPQIASSLETGHIGLAPGSSAAADFFKEAGITGPIFNNYDIGSYLIFYLYPHERVFVDNRPEAYPASFFEKTYIPMQEDREIWKEEDQKYNFNVIFFYRRDATPWGQKFLVDQIADSLWAPVFVDDYNIIFLKRNEKNKDIISRYEIPRERFSVARG